MAEPFASISTGASGGLLLPNHLQPSIREPTAVCQRRIADGNSDPLPAAAAAYLPAQHPPNLQWIGPHDLGSRIRPLAAQDAALQALADTLGAEAPPTGLLRGLLSEGLGQRELRRCAACAGNQLAACEVESSSSPQCLSIDIADVTQQAICQLALNPTAMAASSASQAAQPPPPPRLLAVRCTCSIAVLQLCSPDAACEGGGGWSLRTVAIVRTRLRTLDLAWSHAIPAELAYLLDDGSVHLLDAATAFAPEAAAAASPPGQAKVHCILPAAALEPHWDGAGRVAAAFAPHPRQLLLGAGRRLLRCTVGGPGQPPRQPAVLHERPVGDTFVALAHVDQAGADADAANLLATLTTRHVLLFDLRRPAQPLLQWPHGLEAARPQLLSLFCRPGPANAAAGGQQPAEARQLRGRIVAGSLGTGDVVAFAFSISRASVSVVALPAEPAASQQRSRRREGATQQGFRGQLLLCSGEERQADSSVDAAARPPSFRWRPLLGAVAQAEGLPRRLAAPLGVRPRGAAGCSSSGGGVDGGDCVGHPGANKASHPGADTALAALHPALSWSSPQHALDLQASLLQLGFAVLPGLSAPADGMLLRLNFLGDLHFNSCVLFSDARLPAGGGGDGGSLHRWPQTMGTASGQLTEEGDSPDEEGQANVGAAAVIGTQEEWQPKRQKGRGQIRQRGPTRRLATGAYVTPIAATYAAVVTAVAAHAAAAAGQPVLTADAGRSSWLFGGLRGATAMPVPASAEAAAAAPPATAAGQPRRCSKRCGAASEADAAEAFEAALAAADVPATERELAARWRAHLPGSVAAGGSDASDDLFADRPAALAATLPRGKRGAAHPATLSSATRLTRLSAAAEAAAAGAGDHGSGSIGSLQDFRRRMAAHLRGLPPSQGLRSRDLLLPPLPGQSPLNAGRRESGSPGAAPRLTPADRHFGGGTVVYPFAPLHTVEPQSLAAGIHMDRAQQREALDPEAAALLELLDAEWRAAEAAAGGAPAAAAVGPSGTPGGSKPAAAARRQFAGGGRGHALVSPLRRVAQHAAGSGAARSAPGAPAPAAAAGGRRLVGSKRPAAADGFEVSPPPPQQQAGAAASQPPLGAQPTPQRPLKRRALTQPLQDGF